MLTTSVPASLVDSSSSISDAQVHRFMHDGFVALPSLVPAQQALEGRTAAMRIAASSDTEGLTVPTQEPVFHQIINVWRSDATLRGITFAPQLLAAVTRLAGGRPMRLFHDQLFIKYPDTSVATEFHQDLPYWPIQSDTFTISAWIALGDITPDHGCLTFIPGTHRLRGSASDLRSSSSLMEMYPHLAFSERATLPLAAGGCTLHQGYAAHRAAPNRTSEIRIALSVIFFPQDACCAGDWHVLTKQGGWRQGERFPDVFCPPIT